VTASTHDVLGLLLLAPLILLLGVVIGSAFCQGLINRSKAREKILQEENRALKQRLANIAIQASFAIEKPNAG
jgi:Tfp pilus assembly protein PilN